MGNNEFKAQKIKWPTKRVAEEYTCFRTDNGRTVSYRTKDIKKTGIVRTWRYEFRGVPSHSHDYQVVFKDGTYVYVREVREVAKELQYSTIYVDLSAEERKMLIEAHNKREELRFQAWQTEKANRKPWYKSLKD